MMRKFFSPLVAFFALVLGGCNNNSLDFYKDRKNKIDLRTFFDGEIEGWGGVFDFQGRQIRSFHVKIKASWQGDAGVLDECFTFDDGEKIQRRWEINYQNETMFVGKAGDVIGEAEGAHQGNAANLNYTLQIPYGKGPLNLAMDDWMYLVQEGVVLNRTAMKKWGLKVGEVVLVMKKVS